MDWTENKIYKRMSNWLYAISIGVTELRTLATKKTNISESNVLQNLEFLVEIKLSP